MPSKTNGHKTKGETITAAPPLPTGYKRIRLYPPVWRGAAGDKIKGPILSVEPIETIDGLERNAVMVKLTDETPVLRYSARGEGIDDSDGGGKPAPLGHVGEVVAVPVTNLGSIGRLMPLAEHPELAQILELHAVGVPGGAIRYEAFVTIVPAQRADVDPKVQAAMSEAVRLAQRS